MRDSVVHAVFLPGSAAVLAGRDAVAGRAGSEAESGGPLGDFPGAFAAGSLRAAALGLVLAGLLTTLGVARAGGGGGD